LSQRLLGYFLLQVRQQGHHMNYVPPSKISLKGVTETLKKWRERHKLIFPNHFGLMDFKKKRESEKILKSET
jgi:hypothetical protein